MFCRSAAPGSRPGCSSCHAVIRRARLASTLFERRERGLTTCAACAISPFSSSVYPWLASASTHCGSVRRQFALGVHDRVQFQCNAGVEARPLAVDTRVGVACRGRGAERFAVVCVAAALECARNGIADAAGINSPLPAPQSAPHGSRIHAQSGHHQAWCLRIVAFSLLAFPAVGSVRSGSAPRACSRCEPGTELYAGRNCYPAAGSAKGAKVGSASFTM